jgi:hypothetical protein
VESIKRVNLWWGSNFRGLEYGTSILHAQELHVAKLQQVGDLWDPNLNGFHFWEEVRNRFQFAKGNPLKKCIRELKPSPLTKLQAKMARCKMFGPREGAKRRQVSFGLCGTRPLL